MASNMERSRVILKAPLIAPGGGHRTSLIDRLCSRQVRPANRYAGLAAAGCAVIIAGFHTADSVRPCPPPVRGALQQGESLFESRKPRARCRAAADSDQVHLSGSDGAFPKTHQRRPFAQKTNGDSLMSAVMTPADFNDFK